MPTEKPPYSLVIDLKTYHPDALKDTLDRLRELCDEQEQSTGELKTKLTIESWQEDALIAIRNQIESYLRHNKLLISGEATVKGPLVRPRPEPTPMEQALGQMLGDGIDAVELSGGGHTVRVTR
jgi:hypothetical protein